MAPRISRQSLPESFKVVSSTHRPPVHPRRYSWYSFLVEAESIPGQVRKAWSRMQLKRLVHIGRDGNCTLIKRMTAAAPQWREIKNLHRVKIRQE